MEGEIKMADLKRMSIKVSPEMHEWLSVKADKSGLTMNAIIIFALERYVEQSSVTPHINEMIKALQEKQ